MRCTYMYNEGRTEGRREEKRRRGGGGEGREERKKDEESRPRQKHRIE